MNLYVDTNAHNVVLVVKHRIGKKIGWHFSMLFLSKRFLFCSYLYVTSFYVFLIRRKVGGEAWVWMEILFFFKEPRQLPANVGMCDQSNIQGIEKYRKQIFVK